MARSTRSPSRADDTTVVSGGDDNAIKVWGLTSGELRETLTGHAHCVDWRCHQLRMVERCYSVSLDGSMIVWDLQGSRRLGRPFVASSGSFQPVTRAIRRFPTCFPSPRWEVCSPRRSATAAS